MYVHYRVDTLVFEVCCKILCRYSINSGHLFALSCAGVLLVYLSRVCSCAWIFDRVLFITFFHLFLFVSGSVCLVVCITSAIHNQL